jgi:hypothetical protein
VHSIALGAGPSTFAGNLRGVPGIIARGLADQLIKGYMRIYYGTETQTADSLIAATEGAADTPAFRGTAYVIFESFQLADYANHIPNFEFEVVRAGDYSYPFFNPALSGVDFYTASLDTFRNRVYYCPQHPAEGDPIYVWNMTADAPEEFALADEAMIEAIVLYDAYKDEVVVIERLSGASGEVHWLRYDAGTGALLDNRSLTTSQFGPYVNWEGNTEVGGIVNVTAWTYDPKLNRFYGRGEGFSSGDIFLVTMYTQTQALIGQVVAPAGVGGWDDQPPMVDADDAVWACGDEYLWKLTTPTSYFDIPATAIASSAFYWATRDEIWVYADAGAATGWMIFDLATESWAYANDSGYQDATASYSRGVMNSEGQAWFFKVSGSAVDLDAILVNSDLTIAKTLTDFVGAPEGLGHYYMATVGVIVPFPQNATAQAFYEHALEPGTVALSDVVEDLCAEVDLTAVDVSDLTGEVVRGYVRARPMTARQALEPLALAYSFDGVESDATAKFVQRGGASVTTFETDELAARAGGDLDEGPAEEWTATRALETELPVTLTLGYANPATDYQPATVQARRLTGRAEQEVFHELPLVFTSAEAAQACDRLMRQAWIERERYAFTLGPEWHRLDPTDVVALPDETRVRLTRTALEPTGILQCEAVGDDQGVLTSYAVGTVDERSEDIEISIGGPSTLAVLDIPLLLDQHDDEGLYFAASGLTTDWRGAVVYKSTDGGVTWSGLVPARTSAKIGRITSGAMSGSATGGLWDHGSIITVRFNDPAAAPESAASLDTFYNGANAAAVGDEDEWEIVQFYDVVDNGDGSYTLKNFLRGRRGTEWAIRAHQVGARFVVLESPEVVRAPLAVALIGSEILYRAVTIGGSLIQERTVSDTFSGVSMKPYAPVEITHAKQAANGDIQLRWTRRARMTAEWTNGIDVPLDETAEEYDLEFWTEGYGTLLRTVEALTEAEYTYTAAMQAADFGSPGDVDFVAVRIYQISDRVGRGYPGEALVGAVPAPVTFHPTSTGAGFTLSLDLRMITRSSTTTSRAPASRGYRYGKWYWEFTLAGSVTNDVFLGISLGVSESSYWRWRGNAGVQTSGATDTGEDVPAAHSGTKVYMFAWDAETGEGWMGVDGVWSSGGDPAEGTLPNFTHTPDDDWRPYVRSDNVGSSYSVAASFQFGNVYDVPETFTLIR